MSAIDNAAEAFENAVLYAAIETARVGLCVINPRNDVVVLTKEFAKKIGQPAEEVLGRNARRLLAADRFFVVNFAELIDLQGPEISSQASYRVDDEVSVLAMHATTIVDPRFGRFRVISILDVQDFGFTPSRLIETRRQIEAMRSAVVIADLGVPDYPITSVNRRFEQMTGYAASEVLGRNCRFLQGPERSQPALTELRTSIRSLRPCHVVLKNFRKNGEPFMNELFITPVFDGFGCATHMLGIQREVNERLFAT